MNASKHANQLKLELLKTINQSDELGHYSDVAYERLQELMGSLADVTPIPSPYAQQAFVQDHWQTLYAQFGPRHTAGKSVVHENKFHFVSWSNLPAIPFRNLDLRQEIHADTKAYNNVHMIQPISGGMDALYTLYGRYDVSEANPKRYSVEFYRGEITGAQGESEAQLREAFGFEPDQPLSFEIDKSPPLHSDIVYCDHEIRINYGSVGGKYVLRRKPSPWLSVSVG